VQAVQEVVVVKGGGQEKWAQEKWAEEKWALVGQPPMLGRRWGG
jgi:hypothetical protein